MNKDKYVPFSFLPYAGIFDCPKQRGRDCISNAYMQMYFKTVYSHKAHILKH